MGKSRWEEYDKILNYKFVRIYDRKIDLHLEMRIILNKNRILSIPNDAEKLIQDMSKLIDDYYRAVIHLNRELSNSRSKICMLEHNANESKKVRQKYDKLRKKLKITLTEE